MKSSIVQSLAVSALLFVFIPKSSAQPTLPDQRPFITVTGTSEIKVLPDEIYVEIGVEVRDPDLSAASMSADAKIEGAIRTLKQHGVEAKNIKTGYVNLRPEYRYSQEGGMGDQVNFYAVTRQLEFCLTDTRKFDDLLGALMQSGVNNVYNVRLSTSKLRERRDEARRQAARAAKEKADLLAAELGAKVGKAVQISEGYDNPYPSYPAAQNVSMNAPGDDAANSQGALSLGTISISATVNVTFLLE